MQTTKRITVVLLFITGVLLLAYWGPRAYTTSRIHHVMKIDQEALLAECRDLIASNSTELSTQSNPGAQLGLSSSIFPPTIRRLRPKYVLIRKDHVFICLNAMPRCYLMAFGKGATEYVLSPTL